MLQCFKNACAFLGVVTLLACSPPTPDTPAPPPKPPLPFDPYEAGKVEAIRDLKKGILTEKTFGDLPEWLPQYRDILRTNYQVGVVVVGEDDLTLEMIDRIRGYNEVSVPEIERLHGEGILKRVAEEAEDIVILARAATTPPEAVSSTNSVPPANLPGEKPRDPPPSP